MTTPPSGQVTFLFTDVEGSTVLWDQQPDEMKPALAEHDRRIRSAVAAAGGYVFTTAGDSFAVAFSSVESALNAATVAQLSLLEPSGNLELRVRMGMHTGTASMRDGDYFGVVVNRCARLMSVAHGGQVLLSQISADLLRERLPDEVDLIDLGEHMLKGLADTERIYQLLHSPLETEFPPLRTLEGPSSNLPTQLTSFVGRERELGELHGLLAGNRLVTLTGSGGAGKTRLALHVASDVQRDFPDGVRLVELAAITDSDVLVDEVAAVFGAQASPDTPLVETMVAAIGQRRMLLVLDNCEQLVSAAASLSEQMLSSCPNLRILATSRELLSVEGEIVYRVPSLAVPESDVDSNTAYEYDAVELFVERAQLASPDFRVTDLNVEHVAVICSHLDGIPLALELAAARLRIMSPAQIAARLDERFLSVGGERSRSTRQRTLRGAIDWSHNLLEEPERVLFRRLSCFTGDFTVEAAEYVCSGSIVDEEDVAELFFGLVDKSMVAPEHGAGGFTRYQLLESIRHFGLQRLEEAEETVSTSIRHMEYYAQFCEVINAKRRSGHMGEALGDLDENEDNLRAALRFSLDQKCLEVTAQMVGELWYLWYTAGLYREGIEWCSQLFDQDPDLPDATRAGALHAYGTLLGSWAQPEIGAVMLEQEVDLRRRLADPARLAAALNNLGNLLHDLGRFDAAEDNLREAIDQFRTAGESPTLALSSLGYGYMHAGNFEQAASLYAEALDEAVAVEDAYGVALATTHLGQCAMHQGRLAEGRVLVEDARERFVELKVTPGIANADFNLAVIDRGEGQVVDAAWRLLASLEAPEAHWYLAGQYWILQVVASITADNRCAAQLIGAADVHYASADGEQPAFILEDLAATRQLLESRLGRAALDRDIGVGGRLTLVQVIALAAETLHALIASVETHGGGVVEADQFPTN
jgi:predicted ATPase/class 3 adenylate cyclase